MSNKKKNRLGLVRPDGTTAPARIPEVKAEPKQIQIPDEDLATILEAFKPIEVVQTEVAKLRLDYLDREGRLLSALHKVREKYNQAILLIGKKHGIDFNPENKEVWRFEASKKAFFLISSGDKEAT